MKLALVFKLEYKIASCIGFNVFLNIFKEVIYAKKSLESS